MWAGDPFVAGKTNYQNLHFNKELIKANLVQYLIGSMLLAVVASTIFGLVSYFFLQKFNPEKPLSHQKG